jgi:hypothetical protein
VDASDSRCIGKIIARDVRLVASQLYRRAVTRPRVTCNRYTMIPFRHMVRVGHNARVFVYNRRPTVQEDTVKQRWEGDMQPN